MSGWRPVDDAVCAGTRDNGAVIRTRTVAWLALALLVPACSGAPQDPSVSPERASRAERGVDRTPDERTNRTRAGGRDGATRRTTGRQPAGDTAVTAPSVDAVAPGERAGALFPRPGRYVLRQRGYEKFCGTVSCAREPLPRRGIMRVELMDVADGAATIAMINRSSKHGSTRSTISYDGAAAHITNVTVRFSYETVTYERDYEPRPAVRSLRFPLERGATWASSWTAETSGTYKAAVAGFDWMRAGGRRVRAARVVTATTFSGEFDGRSDVVVWIDPRTRAPIASEGTIDVTSEVGRFVSEFKTLLTSGPAYR